MAIQARNRRDSGRGPDRTRLTGRPRPHFFGCGQKVPHSDIPNRMGRRVHGLGWANFRTERNLARTLSEYQKLSVTFSLSVTGSIAAPHDFPSGFPTAIPSPSQNFLLASQNRPWHTNFQGQMGDHERPSSRLHNRGPTWPDRYRTTAK